MAAFDTMLLRRNGLFAVLDDAEMEAMLEFAKQQRVLANERIFAKGDRGDSLFVILRGRVAVQTESEDAKVMLLNILDTGALFGEIAMLDGGERTATVVAQEPTELLRVDRQDFMPFLSRRPDLCIRLMTVLCQRVRWTSAIIEDTVFLNVPRRLAKRLLMLAQAYGRPIDTGIRITAYISQEDLANMLGVSRESVNKTLKQFQVAGAIGYRNGFIVIQDESFLDQASR